MNEFRKRHCCDQDAGCDAYDCDAEETCECPCSRCYGDCDYCTLGEAHDSCGAKVSQMPETHAASMLDTFTDAVADAVQDHLEAGSKVSKPSPPYCSSGCHLYDSVRGYWLVCDYYGRPITRGLDHSGAANVPAPECCKNVPAKDANKMFGQMRRRRSKPKPCPCKGLCTCHQESREHWSLYLLVAIVILFMVGITFFLDAPAPKRYVYVQGKRCEIHWVRTGITSTGAGTGHDEALCPDGTDKGK